MSETKKVILNKCYGGFGLSEEAHRMYAQRKGLELFKYKAEYNNKTFIYKYTNDESMFNHFFTKDFGDNVEISNEDFEKYCLYLNDKYREDNILIEIVEELKERAYGPCSELVIVEIPADLNYVIDDYDGVETLHEKVQEW